MLLLPIEGRGWEWDSCLLGESEEMGKRQVLQLQEDMKRAERPGIEAVSEPRFHTSC